MKITAEFNSNEELISFINTFGTRTLAEVVLPIEKKEVKVDSPKEAKKEEVKKVESPKEDVEKEETKVVDPPKEEIKEVKKVVDPKVEVTMEMVRAVFTKLIKAGKQKEAKEITTKFGASKLPELKEEDYAAVIKEAEAIL